MLIKIPEGTVSTLLIAVLLILLPTKGISQIFPSLQGDDLVQALQQTYTPHNLLNDTQVKDTLYARIFIEGDTVRCIYSALPRFLPDNVDPSQYLFGSGLETNSINLEHSWPQAKGADEGTDGNTDMHHLYPSRTEINSDRANHPYLNSPDTETNKWYLLFQEMSNKPNANIDAYSELGDELFEPRESVKGDIARAMFYFWTMYRDDAMEADPNFFELQREDLCQWHLQDPAHAFESLRNVRIAEYQGTPNPFILDCSLAQRTYCPEISECTTSADDLPTDLELVFDSANKRVMINTGGGGSYSLFLINILGQIVHTDVSDEGNWVQLLDYDGFYFLIVTKGETKKAWKIFLP